MASVNKVILVGNLGADPEIRHLPNGNVVANVRLATTDNWKDKNGAKQERTEWHRVTFYGRQAEIVGEYLRKDSQIFIEGRLQTRKWQDKNGQDRYTTEIVADTMQMLGGGKGKNQTEQTLTEENDIDVPFPPLGSSREGEKDHGSIFDDPPF